MRLGELLDGQAAAQHRQAEAAIFRRRVGAEQAHAPQAGERLLGHDAGLLDRRVVRLQLLLDEFAHAQLPAGEVGRQREIHGDPWY